MTILLIVESVLLLAGIVYILRHNSRNKKRMQKVVEEIAEDTEVATTNTLLHFPLPLVAFRLSDTGVVWGNKPFWTMCGQENPLFEMKLSGLVENFSGKWMMEGKTRYPGIVTVGNRKYEISGNIVRSGKGDAGAEYMGLTYWVEVTDYEGVVKEYADSRPVVMNITVDNYEELMKSLTDRQRTELRSHIDAEVEKYCEGKNGFWRRLERDTYIFIFERRYLDQIKEERFSLVESMHEIQNNVGIRATVSIGLGVDGATYAENTAFAELAADMALSRGGDQAVVKNKVNFEFYGGRGAEVETRTKVKSRVMATSLARLMQNADQVFCMGHRYPDIDSVGAAVGICTIARKFGHKAKIVIDSKMNSADALLEHLENSDDYKNCFISPQDAMVAANNKTLLVVVDTNRPEQVEDRDLLEACHAHLAVIDHHRRAATYIKDATLTLYEPNASSACELVTEMMEELLKPEEITSDDANAVLAGIVLDTKHFTIRTGERTFEAAAYLRRNGADTAVVKRLFQNDLSDTVERYNIIRQAQLYKNVAIAVCEEGRTDRVVAAQAADELLNVSGVSASAVIYEVAAGEINISARSIGDLNVQVLLEKLGGGGNRSAAGAQLKGCTLDEAEEKVRLAIDEYEESEIKEEKES